MDGERRQHSVRCRGHPHSKKTLGLTLMLFCLLVSSRLDTWACMSAIMSVEYPIMLLTSTASRQLSASLASHPISQLSRITKILALSKGQSNLRSDILMRIIKPACWDATS
ncbi:hypothetical protein FOZG_09548 [Fusarium oxysporum Fo47]|uniref:Uncharacterized protein n=1 Tax=Fusarium oxysporum Fo47 TaxID=660027 RepID=W9JZI5_FUSOX|nr:hypothetical protein FOZG_09548 [Fusarium oxysporum Fo47]